MSDAQAPHSNKPTLGREVGGSKQSVGLCISSGLVNLLGQLMTGAVQCGPPSSLCASHLDIPMVLSQMFFFLYEVEGWDLN